MLGSQDLWPIPGVFWSRNVATSCDVGMDHELDDEGTTWNHRARQAAPERMSPRQAWRAIMRQMPKDASWQRGSILHDRLGSKLDIRIRWLILNSNKLMVLQGLIFDPSPMNHKHLMKLGSLFECWLGIGDWWLKDTWISQVKACYSYW